MPYLLSLSLENGGRPQRPPFFVCRLSAEPSAIVATVPDGRQAHLRAQPDAAPIGATRRPTQADTNRL